VSPEPRGAVETQEAPAQDRDSFNVFINYRREDSAGHAGRLYDPLSERFGDDHVFMDVDAIDPGEDFAEVVEQKVGSCDVLIALIGRSWVTTTDREGRRRLHKPHDFSATAKKEQFLSEYNALRQRELDLPPINPSY
jgi:hypothetical protein